MIFSDSETDDLTCFLCIHLFTKKLFNLISIIVKNFPKNLIYIFNIEKQKFPVHFHMCNKYYKSDVEFISRTLML